MKSIIALGLLLIGIVSTTSAQVLLEDKQGDQIANTAPLSEIGGNANINSTFIKLNTGDQSLGFNYIKSTKLADPSNYHLSEFGIKAKSTDGVAAIFSNGQFSPGIKANYGYTKVVLLSGSGKYIDWGGFAVSYAIDKYSLYKKDTTFANQVYPQTFKGLSITFNYNALINSNFILNIKTGYNRANNTDDLTTVNLQDVTSSTDPTGAITRQVLKNKTAKDGKYKEYDSYPLIIGFTKATPTDAKGTPDADKLRLGYTVYLKNSFSSDKPKTNAGVLFFLTKQDKAGVRAPVLGLDIQAVDPFDVKKQNNGLQNRIAIGLSTVFTL